MKTLILSFTLLSSFSALATQEYTPGSEGVPSEARLATAHSCFKELADLGCGHPREDVNHFKSCLDQNLENLTSSCKTFAKRLYGQD